MAEPLSEEEVGRLREVRAQGHDHMFPNDRERLLATIDARDAEIARLRAALAHIAAPPVSICQHCAQLDEVCMDGCIARRALDHNRTEEGDVDG